MRESSALKRQDSPDGRAVGSRPHSSTSNLFDVVDDGEDLHWAFTLRLPRRVKRRMPLFCRLAKTGSTVAIRRLVNRSTSRGIKLPSHAFGG